VAAAERPADRSRRRPALLAICLLALLLRLGSLPQVLGGGRVLLDGTDGYYHLRRALLTLADWPHVPQRDPFLGPPAGGLVQWGPLFDLTLATLARVWPADPVTALEAVGVRLPVLLGLGQVLVAAALARRLAGGRAGLVAAFLAAILPAAVRYTLLGALDHDPAVELLLLLALLASVLPLTGGRRSVAVALAAASLAALPLTWTGSELHLALLGLALVGAALGAGFPAVARSATVVAVGALVAAAVVAPFAAASVWSELPGVGFAGLSWLHVAVLAGLSAGAAALAWLGRSTLERRERLAAAACAVLSLVALAVLLPRTAAPLLAGIGYAGRQDPFVARAAESRPLLTLLGPFDVGPALVRLSALPLLLPLFLVRARPRRELATGLTGAWCLGAVALALVQARYAHTAALALAVLGGIVWERSSGRAARLAFAAALLPCVAAFLPVPGLAGLRLYGRLDDLVTTGMAEVTPFLAAAAPPPAGWTDPRGEATGAVLAPWGWGHWIEWQGRRPTVTSPLGPYGNPETFRDGLRFWLLDDEDAARDLLARHSVRWVVAPTAPQPPWELAVLAKDDPRPWRRDLAQGAPRFVRTFGARLAWSRPPSFLREVYRTSASRALPDGTLEPLVRVYEVETAAAPAGSAGTGG